MPTGKTILITGATDGLGKAVARHLAAQEVTLIIHGRNPAKGTATVQELQSINGNKNIFYYNADFASLEEVKTFSQQVIANHKHLHVLINNAAIGGGPKGVSRRERSKDGFELRFAVNYLAHFLLTHNLLPLLLHSAPARIVNVSSVGQAPLDFNDLMMEKQYDSFDAYCRSKLAQIIFGFELADQLAGTGVSINSLHPATLMNTNMVHQFFGRTSSSVEEGAKVVQYVAFSPETEEITGAYFHQFNKAKAASQAYDETARKKLWAISEEVTKKYWI
jgi:NAD(P)-dependent dehydrogenase (short-subunit alcohol dehydrogenase family)